MKDWNDNSGCGVEGSQWCSAGSSVSNKFALCAKGYREIASEKGL